MFAIAMNDLARTICQQLYSTTTLGEEFPKFTGASSTYICIQQKCTELYRIKKLFIITNLIHDLVKANITKLPVILRNKT